MMTGFHTYKVFALQPTPLSTSLQHCLSTYPDIYPLTVVTCLHLEVLFSGRPRLKFQSSYCLFLVKLFHLYENNICTYTYNYTHIHISIWFCGHNWRCSRLMTGSVLGSTPSGAQDIVGIRSAVYQGKCLNLCTSISSVLKNSIYFIKLS